VHPANLDSDFAPDWLTCNPGYNSELADGYLTILHHQCPGPWINLFQGLAGTDGVPSLTVAGDLLPGEELTLKLSHTAPGAPAFLVVGFVEIDLPVKGGVLVPAPTIIAPIVTDAAGQFTKSALWPMGIPVGLSFLVQAWIVDAQGPQGFAASNAAMATSR
jgi:hypothetical protein